VFLSGCRRAVAPDADVDVADGALRTAMNAWKDGKSQADLENGQPSIIVNEDDWRTGKKLMDFKMEHPALSGRQIRCRVRLNLKEKDGKTVERNATYIVDTTPRIVIVRDMFASSSLRSDRLALARRGWHLKDEE
jgi:hypothetical protein